MDTDIYRAARLAYRLGRQDQQRILEHRLRKQDAGEALADQIRDLAAGMTDDLVDFSTIIRAAEEGSTPLEAVNSAAPVNSERPRSLTALKFRHTETCPRISEPGSECLVCEFAQHLKREQDRHRRYSEGIRASIGDDRDKRDTGEPMRSDANEVRRMRQQRAHLREHLGFIAFQFCERTSDADVRVCPDSGDCLTEYCLSCYARATQGGGW